MGWRRTSIFIKNRASPPSQRRDAWQLPPFEPFQECAASGRDVAEIPGDIRLRQGRDGVAAAGDAQKSLGARELGDALCDRDGAALEGRCLEGAERPVPDQRLGRLELRV